MARLPDMADHIARVPSGLQAVAVEESLNNIPVK